MRRPLRALFLLLFPFAALALHANISFQITHEHCGDAGGYVHAMVTGGVPPYTYSWDNGATTSSISSLVAGSYTLTVTDNLGAQQVATAVVQNLPSWEWDPNIGIIGAIPSCIPGPEPNQAGWVFFGGDIPAYPMGPGPHQFDAACVEQPFSPGSYPSDWWFLGGPGYMVLAHCAWASPGETYAVNYTDANGCPGYMEAVVPQVPQFFPITILDVQGSCSGGANGSVLFSIPPEPDYIYGARPRLYDPDGQENYDFSNYLAGNWTMGGTYDVPDLGPGEHMLVRRLSNDPNYAWAFPCGDTTYFTIPDLGPTCGVVEGTVALDLDEDCALDGGDTRVPEMIVEFTPGPYYATTNSHGEYSIHLPLGTYNVTQQSAVVDEHCQLDPIQLDVLDNMSFDLLDTATQALDLQLSMTSGPARPGFELHYAIDVDNLTSAFASGNSLMMTFDAAVSYISATPNPSNVTGNTITWNNIGNVSYFGHRDVSVRLQVPPDVGLIGTDLQASATLTNAQDGNSTNNSVGSVVTVTGSYDPNDKTATTSSQWSRELYYIDQDQWIDYTIRLQNTGTDTAFTVVLTDTLPPTLDASTLVMGAGSHPFTWSLQDNGTLKCYFVNILLPDSNANEPASHGFVSFRIQPKQPVVPGTLIENTANIFFDYNPPVITEPSVLTAEFSTGVPTSDGGVVSLFPNPAQDQLTVVAGTSIERLVVLGVDARPVVQAAPRASRITLDASGLPSGLYITEVHLRDGGVSRSQFIKH